MLDIDNPLGITAFHIEENLNFDMTITFIMEDCYYLHIKPPDHLKAIIREWKLIFPEYWIQRIIDKIKLHQYNWPVEQKLRLTFGEVFLFNRAIHKRNLDTFSLDTNNLLHFWNASALPALEYPEIIGNSDYEPVYFNQGTLFDQHKQCIYSNSNIKIDNYCTEHQDYPLFIGIVSALYKTKKEHAWISTPNSRWPTAQFLADSHIKEESFTWIHSHSEFSQRYQDVFNIFKELNIEYNSFLQENNTNTHFLIGKILMALDYPELIDFLFSQQCALYQTFPKHSSDTVAVWETQQQQVRSYLMKEKYERQLHKKIIDNISIQKI